MGEDLKGDGKNTGGMKQERGVIEGLNGVGRQDREVSMRRDS